MQVVNDCRAPHVEEVLADTSVPGSVALPVPDMRQGVFDPDALARFRPSGGSSLPLGQPGQQPFIEVDHDAAVRRQPELGRRDRWLADRAILVGRGQSGLESVGEDLVPVPP